MIQENCGRRSIELFSGVCVVKAEVIAQDIQLNDYIILIMFFQLIIKSLLLKWQSG